MIYTSQMNTPDRHSCTRWTSVSQIDIADGFDIPNESDVADGHPWWALMSQMDVPDGFDIPDRYPCWIWYPRFRLNDNARPPLYTLLNRVHVVHRR